jgi:hypothetical protein
MKLVISIIFKGHSSSDRPTFQFSQDTLPAHYQSIFRQAGIEEPGEIRKIMGQFRHMIQKLHHFEIAQVYQETYVQYLHLLSQITINTSELGDEASGQIA